MPHPDSMEAWEVNHGPELQEIDFQFRAKVGGAIDKFVDDLADLLGDNEGFDMEYLKARITVQMSEAIAARDISLRAAVTDAVYRRRGEA